MNELNGKFYRLDSTKWQEFIELCNWYTWTVLDSLESATVPFKQHSYESLYHLLHNNFHFSE